MATVVVRRNFAPLANLDLVTAEDMRAVGLKALDIIRARTARGLGSDGGPFEAYSPAYAKLRAKEGMGTKPNLQVSGEMLNNMAVLEATDRTVTLGWVR